MLLLEEEVLLRLLLCLAFRGGMVVSSVSEKRADRMMASVYQYVHQQVQSVSQAVRGGATKIVSEYTNLQTNSP